ncbi:MAG: hypothetical protein NTY99_02585 [DPANN group archaeon]|nr:hypothetical protein [DPANN group archaeon]
MGKPAKEGYFSFVSGLNLTLGELKAIKIPNEHLSFIWLKVYEKPIVYGISHYRSAPEGTVLRINADYGKFLGLNKPELQDFRSRVEGLAGKIGGNLRELDVVCKGKHIRSTVDVPKPLTIDLVARLVEDIYGRQPYAVKDIQVSFKDVPFSVTLGIPSKKLEANYPMGI